MYSVEPHVLLYQIIYLLKSILVLSTILTGINPLSKFNSLPVDHNLC